MTSTGSSEWAYFAFYVDNTSLTRYLVFLPNISDSRVAPIFNALEDAWRTGKKVKFLRNSDRDADVATTSWQGYTNHLYQILPGDRVEFIFD
jgi:hypothetical protein